MTQKELLSNIMMMVLQSGVCPETPSNDWPRILIQAHRKGYLYCLFSEDNQERIDVAACAYRIHEWSDRFKVEMPTKEEGNLLYVAWVVSDSGKKTRLLHMFRRYAQENKIDELIYYKRNSNTDLKRIKMKKELV